MAVMPGAEFEEHGKKPISRHDIVCIHTMAGGRAPAIAAHFSTSARGKIFQSRDTKFKSAANQDGNHRIIAIENEDTGGPFPAWTLPNVPDFTEKQVEAIAQICAWAATTHDIPLELCPDSKPGRRGIAYHRQGIRGNFVAPTFKFPGVVPGGEIWTDLTGKPPGKNFGKVCPGDKRITTLIERIIPRAIAIKGGAPALVGLSATLRQATTAEAADMLVGQDKKTGRLWLISGNTKLELPPGKGKAFGDTHSAGNTGHKSVDEVLRMIAEMYPDSNPKFTALDPAVVDLIPEVRR